MESVERVGEEIRRFFPISAQNHRSLDERQTRLSYRLRLVKVALLNTLEGTEA